MHTMNPSTHERETRLPTLEGCGPPSAEEKAPPSQRYDASAADAAEARNHAWVIDFVFDACGEKEMQRDAGDQAGKRS